MKKIATIVGTVTLFGLAILLTIYSVRYKNAEYAAVRALVKLGLSEEDSAVVMAMAKQESNFHQNVVGRYGEVGILQITKAVAKEQGLVVSPYEPRKPSSLLGVLAFDASAEEKKADERFELAANLRVGSSYYLALKRQLAFGHSDLQDLEMFAVGAYNMGPTRLQNLFEEGAPKTLEQFLPWLEAYEGDRIDPMKKSIVIDHLESVSKYYKEYLLMLPWMQRHGKPVAEEYFAAAKNAMVEVVDYQKWFMHLVLGGLIFFLAMTWLVRFMPSGKAFNLAFLLILLLAVVVESLDLREAVINGKKVDLIESVWDVFWTILIPLAWRTTRWVACKMRPKS